MKTVNALIACALLVSPPLLAEVVVPIEKVDEFVNIRMEPVAGSDVIGRLHQGDRLPYLGTEDGWRKVQVDDEILGYISEDWTNVLAEDTTTDLTPDAAAGETASMREGDDTFAIDVGKAVADGATESTVAAGGASSEQTEPAAGVQVTAESGAEPAPVAAEEAQDAAPAGGETVADADIIDEAVAAVPAPDPQSIAEAVAEESGSDTDDGTVPVALTEAAPAAIVGGVQGPAGPPGPPGPPGPSGTSRIEGTENFVVKFAKSTVGANSQIFDDGRNIGIGTTEPQQRLEVNGSIQIHEQNSSVAGLMITQESGDTGYILHNRANRLTIGAGSVDRMTIDRDGNVGIGQARPSHPLEMANGAHVTAGGVWTNSSSIANKENVEALTPDEALAALATLEPVLFNYKTDRDERHVGFIAEDVPDLVATADRKGLSSMDIVAVLTKVVQQQQRQIEELERRLRE